jgi:hypothetical protein
MQGWSATDETVKKLYDEMDFQRATHPHRRTLAPSVRA